MVNVNNRRAFRKKDPETSKLAGQAIVHSGPALSQKERLLTVFKKASPQALTDEEAASLAGLLSNRYSCWWKRCSELRRDGFIEIVPGTRKGGSGSPRMLSRYVEETR